MGLPLVSMAAKNKLNDQYHGKLFLLLSKKDEQSGTASDLLGERASLVQQWPVL